MADSMLSKKSTIALAGGRAFFVPAGFTKEERLWLTRQGKIPTNIEGNFADG